MSTVVPEAERRLGRIVQVYIHRGEPHGGRIYFRQQRFESQRVFISESHPNRQELYALALLAISMNQAVYMFVQPSGEIGYIEMNPV